MTQVNRSELNLNVRCEGCTRPVLGMRASDVEQSCNISRFVHPPRVGDVRQLARVQL
jgi:hypothetical protein